jgi:hypothetical protein
MKMARVVMAHREYYPQNLEQFKSRTRVADKAHKVNNQRHAVASLRQRVARLQSLGAKSPFFAAMPEFNESSSIADIDKANQTLDRLERRQTMTENPATQQPSTPGRPRPDASKTREAPPVNVLDSWYNPARFKSSVEARQDANVASPAAAKPTDALLDKMKSAYGPATRREGDFFRTTVPSESGPRGIDVAAPFVDRMEERTPGWSQLTPQQRASQIYSMTGGKKLTANESQAASGTIVSDFRKGAEDPGTKYLNSLGQVLGEQADARVNQKLNPGAQVDYSRVGDDYAKAEAQRRASAPPAFVNVPANASRAIASDYGAGFAREPQKAAITQQTQAPAGTVIDLFTNTSSPSADALLSERRSSPVTAQQRPGGEQFIADVSAMPFGGLAAPAILGAAKAAHSRGTNLTGPASSSGTANVVGNSITNPNGGAPKTGAIPQTPPSTPGIGAKSAIAYPTPGGAIKPATPAPQKPVAQVFQELDARNAENPKRKFAGFGNISWRN